jgi:hypothetical protein
MNLSNKLPALKLNPLKTYNISNILKNKRRQHSTKLGKPLIESSHKVFETHRQNHIHQVKPFSRLQTSRRPRKKSARNRLFITGSFNLSNL